jgi:hypothetical protein
MKSKFNELPSLKKMQIGVTGFLAIVGLALLIRGYTGMVFSPILLDSNVTKYVGGDAYNYIIESNFYSAKILAQQMMRLVYISTGWIIISISSIAYVIMELYFDEKSNYKFMEEIIDTVKSSSSSDDLNEEPEHKVWSD